MYLKETKPVIKETGRERNEDERYLKRTLFFLITS
jgi:hypothetical protein